MMMNDSSRALETNFSREDLNPSTTRRERRVPLQHSDEDGQDDADDYLSESDNAKFAQRVSRELPARLAAADKIANARRRGDRTQSHGDQVYIADQYLPTNRRDTSPTSRRNASPTNRRDTSPTSAIGRNAIHGVSFNDDESHDAVFKPLEQSQTQIRVVTVQPASSPGDILVCHHLHTDLNDNPQYEALSWCWGDTQDTVTMRLNNQDWQISNSLAECLKKLRRAGVEQRTLWIDALCINQSNSPSAQRELEQQIPLMQYVYGQARRVVIWMCDAPRELAAFVKAAFSSKSITVEELSTKHMPWLIGVLRLAWWRRVWVFQEALLPFHAVCQFGVEEIDFWNVVQVLSEADAHLEKLPRHSLNTKQVTFRNLMKETVYTFSRYREAFVHLTEERRAELVFSRIKLVNSFAMNERFEREARDFIRIMLHCRYMSSSDPRDKIWGLLGLADSALAQKIGANRRHSFKHALQNTIRVLMIESGSLYTLSQALTKHEVTILSDLPSWVPDLRRERRNEDYKLAWFRAKIRDVCEVKFDACLGQRHEARQEARPVDPFPSAIYAGFGKTRATRRSDTSILTVRGLRVMTVSSVGHKMQLCDDLESWFDATKSWRDLVAGRDKPRKRHSSQLSSSTLIGSQTPEDQEVMKEKADENIQKERNWRRNFWFLVYCGVIPGSADFLSVTKHEVRVGTDRRSDSQTQQSYWYQQSENLPVDYQQRADKEKVFEFLTATTSGRKFFKGHFPNSSKPRFGLGPPGLQRGDQIWILQGSTHPIALRPLFLSGASSYQLIGEVVMEEVVMKGSVVRAASGDSEWRKHTPFEVISHSPYARRSQLASPPVYWQDIDLV